MNAKKKISKTKYPDWFSPYFKPVKPIPPDKEITQYDIVEKHCEYSDGTIDIPKGCDCVCINSGYSDGDAYCNINFCKKKQVSNPRYKKLLAEYQKQLVNYETETVEWEKLKARFDEEASTKNLNDRKKLYRELKKEFEKQYKNEENHGS